MRSQLEQVRRHDDQLLSIISTSIQVVVVMALGLAAFSWFTNTRIYERDLVAIRRETESALANAEQRIGVELEKKLQSAKQDQAKTAEDAAQRAITGVASSLADLRGDFLWSEYLKFDQRGDAEFAK